MTFRVWLIASVGISAVLPAAGVDPAGNRGYQPALRGTQLLSRRLKVQWRRQDLNLRPAAYEAAELPDCSTPLKGRIPQVVVKNRRSGAILTGSYFQRDARLGASPIPQRPPQPIAVECRHVNDILTNAASKGLPETVVIMLVIPKSEPDILARGITIRTAAPAMRMPEPSSRLTVTIPRSQRYDRSAEGIVSPGIVDEAAISHDETSGAEQSRLNLDAAAIGKRLSERIHSPMLAQQHGPRNERSGCGALKNSSSDTPSIDPYYPCANTEKHQCQGEHQPAITRRTIARRFRKVHMAQIQSATASTVISKDCFITVCLCLRDAQSIGTVTTKPQQSYPSTKVLKWL